MNTDRFSDALIPRGKFRKARLKKKEEGRGRDTAVDFLTVFVGHKTVAAWSFSL